MAWTSLLLLTLVVGATAAADPEDVNQCQVCRSTVSFATKFNSSSHRQEYTELFRGFCEQYYPPSNDLQQGPCPMFIQGLFYVLDHTDPITYCDEIGVCGPAQPSDDLYQYLEVGNRDGDLDPAAHDDVICGYCKNLLMQLQASFNSTATFEQIKAKKEQLCDYLKVIGEDKACSEHLKLADLARFSITRLNPADRCSKLGLCTQRNTRALPQQKQLPTLADFNNFGIETAVTIGSKPASAVSNKYVKGPGCALCKTVVKEMFHFLRENKTEANIIKGLDRVCKLVYPSSPKQEECESMVKAYTRELVQLLVDETDPEMICMVIGQCTYSKDSEPRQISRSYTTPAPGSDSNDLAHLITALDSTVGIKSARACFECKIFIRYLKDKIDSPQTQEEIKQWLLGNLCKELPEKELVQSCSAMVENYSAVFFKAVVGELNPQTACVELGVCPPKTIVHVLNIGNPASKNSISRVSPAVHRGVMSRKVRCSRCTEVVSNLDTYLATHRYDDDTWNKVCANSAAEKRADYMTILNQHGSDIVQMIPTMESPRHLCQQIHLC